MYLFLYLSMRFSVFVLVDELGFVLIDALVVVLIQVLGCVLVEALVCVPVEQNFKHLNKPGAK